MCSSDLGQAVLASDTVKQLFLNLEANGCLLRLNQAHWPTMYRCATVTEFELDELRRIPNVVRMGRVKQIEPGTLHLEEGDHAIDHDALIVDCSADGLERRPPVPVFDGKNITLQAVRTCQQVFSAAFIGHIEVAFKDDVQKNELATPVPHPDTDIDWIRTTMENAVNGYKWSQAEGLTDWLKRSRLDGFSQVEPLPSPAIQIDMLEVHQKLQHLLSSA